jgi:poly [ADP-ribose] polymerase
MPQLKKLSNDFYSTIPHNFGFAKMSNFIIDTEDKLKQKLDLISSLIDIKVAYGLRKRNAKPAEKKVGNKKIKLEPSLVDQNYDALNCKIEALNKGDKEYEMLNTYLENTSTWSKLKTLNCFKIEREGEAKIFNPNKIGNKKLLWHGSRFSNFVGILSNGMRIAPPEAPASGYAFGKGVYFADLAGKSCGYACPHLSGGVGTFVVCEVALGNQ